DRAGNIDEQTPAGAACLDETDAPARILRQPRGQHAPGGAASYDDEVEYLFQCRTPQLRWKRTSLLWKKLPGAAPTVFILPAGRRICFAPMTSAAGSVSGAELSDEATLRPTVPGTGGVTSVFSVRSGSGDSRTCAAVSFGPVIVATTLSPRSGA